MKTEKEIERYWERAGENKWTHLPAIPLHPPTLARIPPSAPEVDGMQIGHSRATVLDHKRDHPQGALGQQWGRVVVVLTGVPPPRSLPGAGRESSRQVRCSL